MYFALFRKYIKKLKFFIFLLPCMLILYKKNVTCYNKELPLFKSLLNLLRLCIVILKPGCWIKQEAILSLFIYSFN